MASLISFIVPAHNEAFEIGRTLDSIFRSAQAVGVPFEVIVVNDGSTDLTATIARQAGARVLDVDIRKISAVRNAGARQAKGDVFFFVDADTQISERTLRAALQAFERGALGGGAEVRFREPVGRGICFTLLVFNFFYMRLCAWAAGCFLYVRRQDFDAVGGFDETLYASEEIGLSRALKRRGRFVVVRETVTTSGRKLRLYSPWHMLRLIARLIFHGSAVLRQREGLDWWYAGKREK